MRVGFDFDDTICVDGVLTYMAAMAIRQHAENGDDLVVITSRNPDHDNPNWAMEFSPTRTLVRDFLEINKIPISNVVFTNHAPKGPVCRAMGLDLFYDNDIVERASCLECGVSVGQLCR